MLSLRTVARSAPRVLRRAAAAPLRRSAVAPLSLLRPVAAAPFSSSAVAAVKVKSTPPPPSSEIDDDLSAKIESELAVEEDLKNQQQEPSSVKDFLENTPYELQDTPGNEVVRLVRNIDDEKITVTFSIADLTNIDPYSEDGALEDDELPDGAPADQSSGAPPARSGRSNAAASEEPQDEESDEDLDEAPERAPTISFTVLIEKPGLAKGTLSIDGSAQEGELVIDNLFFYEDAKVARLATPEDTHKQSDMYLGPPFGSLDEDLQMLTERFLEERGIDRAMALFIQDYADVKEQKEYVRWLSNIKTFVDA